MQNVPRIKSLQPEYKKVPVSEWTQALSLARLNDGKDVPAIYVDAFACEIRPISLKTGLVKRSLDFAGYVHVHGKESEIKKVFGKEIKYADTCVKEDLATGDYVGLIGVCYCLVVVCSL